MGRRNRGNTRHSGQPRRCQGPVESGSFMGQCVQVDGRAEDLRHEERGLMGAELRGLLRGTDRAYAREAVERERCAGGGRASFLRRGLVEEGG